MTALFGPQGANAVLTKPNPFSQRYGGQQTWVKDCSGPGATDGTVLDASFYNRIIGALDYITGVTNLSALPGDDSTLFRAVLAVIAGDAPEMLNSLKKLADSIGDDPHFADTMATALSLRIRVDAPQLLSALQRAQALSNLGLVTTKSMTALAAAQDFNAVTVGGSYYTVDTNSTHAPTADHYLLEVVPFVGSTYTKQIAIGDVAGPNLGVAYLRTQVNGTWGSWRKIVTADTLGTAATANVGTGPNQVVQLSATSKLPAVDGSQLLNITNVGSLSRFTYTLPSDVVIGNSPVQLYGITAGVGTWLCIARTTVSDTAGAATFSFRLSDGTTIIASGADTTGGAAFARCCMIQGVITNPVGNIQMHVSDSNGVPAGLARANASGYGRDTTLDIIRIG